MEVLLWIVQSLLVAAFLALGTWVRQCVRAGR
jgi:hypothetical protein